MPGQQFFARAARLPLVEHHGDASGGEPVAVLHQPLGGELVEFHMGLDRGW